MNQSTQKKLTLQVDPKEVAYLIQNQLTNEILHFRSYALDPFKNLELELEKMFSSDELLFTDFDEVEILHKNNLNTLVPNEFFNEAVLGSYLQYNVKVFPTDFFASDELVTIKANNVYVPYVAFNNYFIDKFGSFTYKHIFTPLIEYASSQPSKDEQKIWLYKSDETLVILAFKNNELMFFNSFDYKRNQIHHSQIEQRRHKHRHYVARHILPRTNIFGRHIKVIHPHHAHNRRLLYHSNNFVA